MNVESHSTTGRWIWPFEILEQIGEGGMGLVYRARYVVNDRQIALKMLPADVQDQTSLQRFEREMDVLKTLRHPNIVRCFGGTCENKRRFYAMELIEGGTLEDKLREKGRLRWEAVVEYGLQMCAALEASHEKGIVHRDVKPSNFLVTPSGKIKLSDFGLASVQDAQKITAAGKTAGTFLYMAPEQIRGLPVTGKTDLYALGCVLFELITGRAPFIGETPAATLHLHCFSTPARPSEVALDCPIPLERLVLQLLEKDPGKRPDTAASVARMLTTVHQTSVLSGPEGDAEPILSRRLADEIPPEIAAPAYEVQRTMALPRVGQWSPRLWMVVTASTLLILSVLLNVHQWNARRHEALWRSAWATAASSDNGAVREAAARTIGRLMPYRDTDSEVLQRMLQDQLPEVRVAALEGVSEAGRDARSLYPMLLRIQNADDDPLVRGAAESAMDAVQTDDTVTGFPWIGAFVFLLLGGTLVAGLLTWSPSNAFLRRVFRRA